MVGNAESVERSGGKSGEGGGKRGSKEGASNERFGVRKFGWRTGGLSWGGEASTIKAGG
jgi:hypothetical protein